MKISSIAVKAIAMARAKPGFRATCRRAMRDGKDAPALGFLVEEGIDIGNESYRNAALSVLAMIGAAAPDKNGVMSISEALAKSYSDGSSSRAASRHFERLVAANTSEKAAQIVIRLHAMLSKKTGIRIDYVRLMDDLSKIDNESLRKIVHTNWITDFYKVKKGVS